MIRLVFLYLSILVFLTLNPWLRPSSDEVIGFLKWDMVAHAIAYAMLAVVLMLTVIKKGPALVITALVLTVCGFGGGLLELCQYWFTTSRSMSLHDVIANFTGATLGVAAFWSIRFWSVQQK